MQRTIPSSFAGGYAKAYATNATDGSFASRADTTTEPTGDGVVNLEVGGLAPTYVRLEFYGTGDANDVVNVLIYGIARSGGAWTYTPLFQGIATLGTRTGVSGGNVGASELYADTLTEAAEPFGTADVTYGIQSPADNTKALLLLDARGFQKLRIDFDMDTGSPTGANALVAMV